MREQTYPPSTSDYIALADAKVWIEGTPADNSDPDNPIAAVPGHILDLAVWNTATDVQKQIALWMAMDHIDVLLLDGVKVDTSQAREFPRCIYSPSGEPWWFYENMDYLFRGAGWYCQSEVPQLVIDATCFEAVEIIKMNLASDQTRRLDLQRAGVTSVGYGDTRESYAIGSGRRYSGLISAEAHQRMLRFRGHPKTV